MFTENWCFYHTVKDAIFSKNQSIRHESELIQHLRALLQEDPDLQWRIVSEGNDGRPQTLELAVDGTEFLYEPVYELKPSLGWLEGLLPRECPLLIVTPELTRRVLECCKNRGISAIDLNGRVWLRATNLLVDRGSLPERNFRYELEPRNVYVGKSVRIIRGLLTDIDRNWNQTELLKRTDASSGLVSRIIQYLISQGYLEKTSSREFRLRDYLALLDDWAKADRFVKRTRTQQYAGYLGSPVALAQLLQEWAQRESVSIAFTKWIAAWIRHPYTEPMVTSAYVSRLPESSTLAALGLRPVSEGGKLWLHVPEDEGLLTETQSHNELTLTTDAQIYIDLQSTGLRGPDAAKALREWSGFCRP